MKVRLLPITYLITKFYNPEYDYAYIVIKKTLLHYDYGTRQLRLHFDYTVFITFMLLIAQSIFLYL